MRRASIALIVALGASFAGLGASCHPAAPPAKAPAPPVAAPTDYLVIAPRAYAAVLEPLLAHRRAAGHVPELITLDAIARGAVKAEQLYAAIHRVWKEGGHALRFVLLVGDASGTLRSRSDGSHDEEPPELVVPTFYLAKLAYEQRGGDGSRFPSDHPYAVMGESNAVPAKGRATLAVGRIPARDAQEVAGFVQKLIAYEQQPVTSAWPRRLVVHAGQAKMGGLLDGVLSHAALELLDSRVPYDFDLDFTFADPASPYSYRPDRLGDFLTEEADRGALLLAYVGHSSPSAFDWVEYRGQYYGIGSRDSFERMHITEGAPVFLSLSCDAGAFDTRADDRSISEEAVLNPKGPIAAFAASRISHPYPNMLYGEAFIEEFLVKHAPTLGEGVVAVKRGMVERSSLLGELLSGIDTDRLKEEHEGLYNLFGDPATRLRYPERAQIEVPMPSGEGAERGFAGGTAVTLTVRAPLDRGTVELTVETRRREIRAPIVPAAEIAEMPLDEAFAAMTKNHQRAIDKTVAKTSAPLVHGTANIPLTLPAAPGDYVVKALVRPSSGGSLAAGHAAVRVR
jgi:hypothetical protein